jgi:DNA adenine methylase
VRTPIPYYGGKQQLASTIISIIPNHKIYVEPFFGGGAVFFSKAPSLVEVINDLNREMVNFYRQAKLNFDLLEREIGASLHSRDLHRQADVIYRNPDMFCEVKRAWAVWVLANQSYGRKLNGGFGYDLSGVTTRATESRRIGFSSEISERLSAVQIECTDALRIINSRDNVDTLFYLDPPYYNASTGHYGGYTQADFSALLETISDVRGKFILSSYESDVLYKFIDREKWLSFSQKKPSSMSRGSRSKTEVLTMNFTPDVEKLDSWVYRVTDSIRSLNGERNNKDEQSTLVSN